MRAKMSSLSGMKIFDLSILFSYDIKLRFTKNRIYSHVQSEISIWDLFEIPFKLKGVWSQWQFSFWLWTKRNSNWLKIKRKTVTTIIFFSVWKESEIYLFECIQPRQIDSSHFLKRKMKLQPEHFRIILKSIW